MSGEGKFFGRNVLARITEEVLITDTDEYWADQGYTVQITTGTPGANMVSTGQPLTPKVAVALAEALLHVAKAQSLRDLAGGAADFYAHGGGTTRGDGGF